MSREQLDAMLDEACSLACYLLERNREFFPFAVTLRSDGEIHHVQGYTGTEQPAPSEVIELLEAGLANDARSGSIHACAVVRDIRLTPVSANVPTDAIAVALEHETGDPVICFLPYSFEGDELVAGEIIAQIGERRIFPGGAA